MVECSSHASLQKRQTSCSRDLTEALFSNRGGGLGEAGASLANESLLALGPETWLWKRGLPPPHLFHATCEALFRRLVASRRVAQEKVPDMVASDALLAVVRARRRVLHSPFA